MLESVDPRYDSKEDGSLFRRAALEHGELFCWCVEHLSKFPPAEGRWIDELKRRIEEGLGEEADKFAAEVNRRRGSDAVAREALDLCGIPSEEDGITLTLCQRIERLKAQRDDAKALTEFVTTFPDEHVAWLRFDRHSGERPVTIHLCDSDAPGAFKAYKRPAVGPGLLAAAREMLTELEDRFDGCPDSVTLWMAEHIRALRAAIGKSTEGSAA